MKDSVAEEAGSTPARKSLRRKYLVFVMEDSPEDREALLRDFRKSPHIQDVQFFSHGDDLMRHLEEANYYYERRVIHGVPALILLDVYSPGVNGFEVLQKLKGHPMTQDIPVVMMTGDMSSDMRAAALKLQATAYMLKPLKLDDIHEVMLAEQEKSPAF